ncbi:MAG TPA: DUF4398 domain-containing protein [Bacteroidota bacterium]
MKQTRNIIGFILVGAAMLFLFGCSQPPKEEEQAARVALDSARTAEAPAYAANEWTDADQGMTAAEAKMESKDYDEAKRLFLDAHAKAEIAIDAAARGKAQLTTEVDQLKEATQKKVDAVKADLKKAQKKLPKKTASSIAATLGEAETDNADANQLISTGKLIDGKAKLVMASGKADEAASALASAIAPKHPAKKAVKHVAKKTSKKSAKKPVKHTVKKRK